MRGAVARAVQCLSKSWVAIYISNTRSVLFNKTSILIRLMKMKTVNEDDNNDNKQI